MPKKITYLEACSTNCIEEVNLLQRYQKMFYTSIIKMFPLRFKRSNLFDILTPISN